MKKILLAFIICMPLCMCAQITLTTQIPNAGVLVKDQLWNMVITNNTSDLVTLRLEVDITDILLGQSVLNASTGKILVNKGMKLISSREVQPIMYNYVATEFSGNYAPCGSYNIHYRLIQEIPAKGDVPIADEVIRINVTPLSPPMLTTPSDKAGIETVYPQFTWMPPTPIDMFNPLLYDINVVAIEEGQSGKEAIEYNRPVYFNTNIQTPSEKMPTSFEQLQQGKTYAWQVVARSGSACASPSDIWVFSIGKDAVTKIIENAAFTKLSRSNTEITTAQEGVLKIEYINNIGDKEVRCTVYKAGEKQKEGYKRIHFKLKLVDGQNYLSYNINKKQKLKDKTVYELAIKNSKGEEWFMRFVTVYSSK
jgi:hypothetical protein